MFSDCLIDDATRRDAAVDGRSCGWLGGVERWMDAEGKKAGEEVSGGIEI